jgi:hypothetical protein
MTEHSKEYTRHGEVEGVELSDEEIREIDIDNLVRLVRNSELSGNFYTIVAQIRRERFDARSKLADIVCRRIQDNYMFENDLPEKDERTLEQLIAAYKKQYDSLPDDIRSRCTFEELEQRLRANENHYLELARGLRGGGEVAFIDEEGTPVLREGGVEPVLMGVTYNRTREILYGEDYEEGTAHYGYEMPNSEGEVREIARATGRPFVADENRRGWIMAYVESGKNPKQFYYANFRAHEQSNHIIFCNNGYPDHEYSNGGVVRLLRVKKMA